MKIKINKFWSVCISSYFGQFAYFHILVSLHIFIFWSVCIFSYFASFGFPWCVNFNSIVYANFILKKEGLHKMMKRRYLKEKMGGWGWKLQYTYFCFIFFFDFNFDLFLSIDWIQMALIIKKKLLRYRKCIDNLQW